MKITQYSHTITLSACLTPEPNSLQSNLKEKEYEKLCFDWSGQVGN